MHVYHGGTFLSNFRMIRDDLLATRPVRVGTWQSQKIDMPMLELLNVVTEYQMPESADLAGEETGARLPWAEDHHLERVSGHPLNPAPSEAWWPFRKKSDDGDTNKEHKSEGEAFSHTYPERMWPKYANGGREAPVGSMFNALAHRGIRFDYGDLNNVAWQLARDPFTRQAYLPLWFPEDTGAVHGKRVPCSLGWQFQLRGGKLHTSYFMRSTDLLRHYQDDIYLAVRLSHWVREQIHEIWDSSHEPHYDLEMGTLTFHTGNMHIFEGDRDLIAFWKTQGKDWF